ncbi:MAG: glycosyltransferase family 2 protein [Ideonella sp.]|nr:glycosyltransferase family 2 protein [Ideonella sp.]
MKIVTAICTFNRSGLLLQTLNRLTEIARPRRSDWEVLIVDNNCTDDTQEAIDKYRELLPLHSCVEKKQGLSHARNAAVRLAVKRDAQYIIWTDDDVLPCDEWLVAYEDAFVNMPSASVFGGPVEPWFAVPAPRWLQNNWPIFSTAYAVKDLGKLEIPLQATGDQIPFGANYAISIAAQISKNYNPSLGVVGNKRIGGEETEVMRELLANGRSGWWVPSARVRHYIEPWRLTLKYLSSYYRGQGRTTIIQDGKKLPLGVKVWYIRHCVGVAFMLILRLLSGRQDACASLFIEFNQTVGKIAEG